VYRRRLVSHRWGVDNVLATAKLRELSRARHPRPGTLAVVRQRAVAMELMPATDSSFKSLQQLVLAAVAD
jgi:hypothetical protein